MELVGAGHHGCAKQCERRIDQEARTWEGHPPGAQPKQAHGSVSQKMASLANVMMEIIPAGIRYGAEEMLPRPTQRTAGVVCAKPGSRLERDDTDAYDDRPPGTNPVAGRSTNGFDTG